MLMWYGRGFSFSDVLELTPREREWFINRLERQYRQDAKLRKQQQR